MTEVTPDPAARPLRLLIVSSDTYPPTRVDLAILFGEELARRGHRFDCVLQSEGACARAYVAPWGGGRVWVGPTDLGESLFHRVRKHVLGIRHDLRLFSLLRKGDYDAVVVKDKFVSGVFAVIAVALFRRRFVFWLSYPFAEEYSLRATDGTARYPLLYRIRGWAFRILLYRVLLPLADHVIVQSQEMSRLVAAQGTPVGKMTAVPMGIRPEQFAVTTDAQPYRLPRDGASCVLYLGTLSKVRRLDFLIRVLAQVRRAVPGAWLCLVGGGDDPSDEQLLCAEADRCGVEAAVEMVGRVPHAQALSYAQQAEVCVSPIYPNPILNCGSPTKLVEYMAMGKAVVANDHPEQRLVIGESGGGLCVPWDEGAFAAAVVRLLQDPGEARRMGENGRRYALEHRSYVKIADQVEAMLLRVLRPTAAQPARG
jgi:glycosyltransferase involved in cell wall biosynthesis